MSDDLNTDSAEAISRPTDEHIAAALAVVVFAAQHTRPEIENFARWAVAYDIVPATEPEKSEKKVESWSIVVSRPDAWDVYEQVLAYKDALIAAGVAVPERPAEPIPELAYRFGERERRAIRRERQSVAIQAGRNPYAERYLTDDYTDFGASDRESHPYFTTRLYKALWAKGLILIGDNPEHSAAGQAWRLRWVLSKESPVREDCVVIPPHMHARSDEAITLIVQALQASASASGDNA